MPEEVAAEQVKEMVQPERAVAEVVTVGGKEVKILPLKRRWQTLFAQAALPFVRPELSATETMEKSIADGTVDFTSFSNLIIESELAQDAALDRVAGVILASQIPGAEKDTDKYINEQVEWVKDNSTTDELRALVEKQMDKERLVELVGERLPARFARSLHLAGRTDVSIDSVKQRLINSWPKLPEPTGDGNST